MLTSNIVSKYVQGAGVRKQVGSYAKYLGERAFVLGGRTALSLVRKDVCESLEAADVAFQVETFQGFCSPTQIASHSKTARENGCDFVIGVGGGRAIDTAKGVARELECPMLLIPTSPSQCACMANIIIVYNDEGDPLPYILYLRSPADTVLVDTEILILNCPARMLVAGITDAMTKLPEISYCIGRNSAEWDGNSLGVYSLQMADNAYRLCVARATQARDDVLAGRITRDAEDIITANIYLTGLSASLAGYCKYLGLAHTLYSSLCRRFKPVQGKFLHGEMVALGLPLQWMLDGVSSEIVQECVDLLKQLGSPIRLEDLGLESTKETIDQLADDAVSAMKFQTPAEVELIRSIMRRSWISGD